MKPIEFNNLDKLVQSDNLEKMAEQAEDTLKAVQTKMPDPHVPEHVVLPIMKKKEEKKDGQQ